MALNTSGLPKTPPPQKKKKIGNIMSQQLSKAIILHTLGVQVQPFDIAGECVGNSDSGFQGEGVAMHRKAWV